VSGDFLFVRFGGRGAEPFFIVKVKFLDKYTYKFFMHGVPKGATFRFLVFSHPRWINLIKQSIPPFLSFTPLQSKVCQPENFRSGIELIGILGIRTRVENEIL
jgi:hypothetical protein